MAGAPVRIVGANHYGETAGPQGIVVTARSPPPPPAKGGGGLECPAPPLPWLLSTAPGPGAPVQDEHPTAVRRVAGPRQCVEGVVSRRVVDLALGVDDPIEHGGPLLMVEGCRG